MKTKITYLTMALVIALSMALGGLLVVQAPAPAQAATPVTNVWVQFTASDYNKTDTATDFSIHFTPNLALTRGVDTITVWFPDGSTAMGPDNFDLGTSNTNRDYYSVDRDAEVTTYSAVDITSTPVRSTSGYRITIVTPVDLDAGVECTFRVEAAAGVKCADLATGAHHDPYYVKVYTSQDTTPVLSDAFNIDATGPSDNTVLLTLSPATAGSTGQYSFEWTEVTGLSAGEDTVTVIFPYGTTIPDAGEIDADAVSWSDNDAGAWSSGTEIPVINKKARMITCTTPIDIAAASDKWIKFSTAAGIVNPTVATDYTGYYLMTNEDELQEKENGGQTITARTQAKLGFNNDALPSGCYADDATMINMYSSCLFLLVQDTYGNLKNPDTEPMVTYTSTGGSGTFHYNESADGTGLLTMTQDNTVETVVGYGYMYYLPTTSGTHTITAEASGYADGTWTIYVAPGVELYDSYNNLIKTYEPLSTAPASETSDEYASTTQRHGGTYVQQALDASITGDTVKLGGESGSPAIYELDTVLTLAQKITLTSKTGKAYTTLRPTTDGIHAINVTADGTATNPVTIQELTFERLREDYEFDAAVMNDGYDYLTVTGCTFDYIVPDHNSAHEGVVWIRTGSGAITSATISNNLFTNCGMWDLTAYSGKTVVIEGRTSSGSGVLTGLSITGNTFTDCNEYGIELKGDGTSHRIVATITDNIFTNGSHCINMNNTAGATPYGSVTITGNSITDAYSYAIKAESGNGGVTIKNNTITGTAGTNAVTLETPAQGTHYCQYNSIYSNNGYAIYGNATNAQNCQYNWYGNATGPAYTAATGATVTKSNPGGTGDPITDKVTYYPWLHKSLADVVTDSASYQTSTVDLVIGWNTLSTPVVLIPTGDTIGELIPTGRTIGYYYDAFDADADLDYWELLEDSYELSPCDSVYVKMSVAKTVQLKFAANELTTPSKALAAGWNMISLAYLSSSGKHADDAVASVAKTAANLPGYANVVSPSLNTTRKDMYVQTGTEWAVGYGQASVTDFMYTTFGYWIYMQNAATLAGFTITPIAPDLD